MSVPSAQKQPEQQDLAAKQYKIYDIELFKSQLKVFQNEVSQPQQADQKIKIQDQSMNSDQHFPVSYEEGMQNHNNFSISNSLDAIAEDFLPPQNKQIVNNQSKSKLAGDPPPTLNTNQSVQKQSVYCYQDWDSRPRKCSNPMFQPKQKQQSQHQNQLVRQLQILTKQRSRYKQANYFSKKERSIEVKSIQDLFEAYKQSETKKSEANLHANVAATPSRQRKNELLIIDPSRKKDCELCQKTKERIDKHLINKNISPKQSNPNVQVVPQKWIIDKQPTIKNVNMSPDRSSVKQYLAEQNKDQYKSQNSRIIFSGQLPLKQEYLEENKLRQQYLKNAKERSQQIHRQLQKLKYPPKFADNNIKSRSSSRKKIFALSPSASIKKPSQISIIPVTPKTTKHSNEDKSRAYHSIFSSKLDKNSQNSNKRENNSIDFNYVKQELVNTRIHIFNSKSKQKQRSQNKSNSKVKIFNKISPKQAKTSKKDRSPVRQKIVHNFNVIQMSYQTREWYQKNQKQILAQTQKIFSYQLITRYIGESEIKIRLGQFIKGMIEPKRWILLMVDGVYARLKDRYLPS